MTLIIASLSITKVYNDCRICKRKCIRFSSLLPNFVRIQSVKTNTSSGHRRRLLLALILMPIPMHSVGLANTPSQPQSSGRSGGLNRYYLVDLDVRIFDLFLLLLCIFWPTGCRIIGWAQHNATKDTRFDPLCLSCWAVLCPLWWMSRPATIYPSCQSIFDSCLHQFSLWILDCSLISYITPRQKPCTLLDTSWLPTGCDAAVSLSKDWKIVAPKDCSTLGHITVLHWHACYGHSSTQLPIHW